MHLPAAIGMVSLHAYHSCENYFPSELAASCVVEARLSVSQPRNFVVAETPVLKRVVACTIGNTVRLLVAAPVPHGLFTVVFTLMGWLLGAAPFVHSTSLARVMFTPHQ